MPGFFISSTKTKQTVLENYDNSRCTSGQLTSSDWVVQWNVLDKFQEDKCFFETEKYIVALDGVILNKKELLDRYHETEWKSLLIRLIEEKETFFKELRGAFAGAYYKKKEKRWIAFTDQIGNHLLLRYFDGESFVLSSQLNYLSDWMKLNGVQKNISQKWIDDVLSFGYVIDSHTILDKCDRIFPGCYLVYDVDAETVQENPYYSIVKSNTDLSEEEIIDRLDVLFRNAVKRITDKCDEYGYKFVTDISGGLDSRMIAAVVHGLGLEGKATGINYAQSGSLDQKISLEVSRKANIDMLCFPMDNGKCMNDVDSLTFMNQGMNFYIGITGGKYVLENLDRETYGMELWGILGDIYEGAMITEKNVDEPQWDYPRFRTSSFFPIYNKHGYDRKYSDNEIMWFYIRGMIAGQNTAFIRQNYLEAPAVYGDVEFMDFIFSIPYEVRVKNHIYRKWMMRKYPEFANILYSGTGTKVCISDTAEWMYRLPVRIKNKINSIVLKNNYEKHYSMNPLEFWLRNNSEVLFELNAYYAQNLLELEAFPELKSKVVDLYNSKRALDNVMALSIIAAVKQYIN